MSLCCNQLPIDSTSARNSLRCGLTLVELLIVVGILSLLTAVALPVTKTLIAESRVTESVRTVKAFMEMARSKAMASGREHAVELIRAGTAAEDPNEVGSVIEMKIGVGMPKYRGDVEGATTWLFHEATYSPGTLSVRNGQLASPQLPPVALLGSYANVAMFRRTECPTIFRTYDQLDKVVSNIQVTIADGDFLILDGIECEIVGFSECSGSELPFAAGGVNGAFGPADDYIKVYFDPRCSVGSTPSSSDGRLGSMPHPPTLPAAGFWKRTFEIRRTLIRPGQTSLSLSRGAAIDLYFSGEGISGVHYSPRFLYPAATNLAQLQSSAAFQNVTIVFSPSGEVSRIITGEINSGNIVSHVPGSIIYLLVGRSEQVRADLTFSPVLPTNDPNNLSNVVDPRSSWVTINPFNGRISTAPARSPRSSSQTIAEQLVNARLLAAEPQEQQ